MFHLSTLYQDGQLNVEQHNDLPELLVEISKDLPLQECKVWHPMYFRLYYSLIASSTEFSTIFE